MDSCYFLSIVQLAVGSGYHANVWWKYKRPGWIKSPLVWYFFLPHHVSIRSVVELSVESIYLQNFVFYSLLLWTNFFWKLFYELLVSGFGVRLFRCIDSGPRRAGSPALPQGWMLQWWPNLPSLLFQFLKAALVRCCTPCGDEETSEEPSSFLK